MNLRTYTWGILTGIVITVGSFAAVSGVLGVRWQMVVNTAEHVIR